MWPPRSSGHCQISPSSWLAGAGSFAMQGNNGYKKASVPSAWPLASCSSGQQRVRPRGSFPCQTPQHSVDCAYTNNPAPSNPVMLEVAVGECGKQVGLARAWSRLAFHLRPVSESQRWRCFERYWVLAAKLKPSRQETAAFTGSKSSLGAKWLLPSCQGPRILKTEGETRAGISQKPPVLRRSR